MTICLGPIQSPFEVVSLKLRNFEQTDLLRGRPFYRQIPLFNEDLQAHFVLLVFDSTKNDFILRDDLMVSIKLKVSAL